MNVATPKWLICKSNKEKKSEWTSRNDSNGNEIMFAFTSSGKAKSFCRCIDKQDRDEPDFWFPYDKNILHDLCSELDSDVPPEKVFIVIDACGLHDEHYQAVKLTDLIAAMKAERPEIECFWYEPPLLYNVAGQGPPEGRGHEPTLMT